MNKFEDIDLENTTASVLFDKGWKFQQELSKVSDESSQEFETNRKKAILVLQKCQDLLDELGIFSENEGLEEISTNELRYFLTNALIAFLYSKINSTQSQKRLADLELAKDYILKYLILTKNYGFHNFNLENFKTNQSNNQDNLPGVLMTEAGKQAAFDRNLLNAAQERNEKIKRFKELKEFEKQFDAFQTQLSKSHIDDEQKRFIFTTYIKYWLNKSIDEYKIISDEINILKTMNQEGNSVNNAHRQVQAAQASAMAPNKPYIITRDAIQAKVFGAGYPSVPVYSIEQFYDQLADKGMMPKDGEQHKGPVQIGKGVTETQKQEEKAQKDLLEDKDDEDELRKQREWDEFKDENKRGSGNRYNRS